MNQTILIAVLTLVLAPLLVALLNNLILRLGKKDDITLQRETLLLQKEAALELKREKLAADMQKAFAELEADFKSQVDEMAERNALLRTLGTDWPEMRELTSTPGAMNALRANRDKWRAENNLPNGKNLSTL